MKKSSPSLTGSSMFRVDVQAKVVENSVPTFKFDTNVPSQFIAADTAAQAEARAMMANPLILPGVADGSLRIGTSQIVASNFR